MLYKIILPLFLLLFIQCKNSEIAQTVEIVYAQTQGIDPWACPCQTNEELKNAAEKYFIENISNEFENLEISYDDNFEQACDAPYCTTGTLIHMEVSEEVLAKFIEFGFIEN